MLIAFACRLRPIARFELLFIELSSLCARQCLQKVDASWAFDIG
jgi:hypothetical protein